jgi:hypothetical protein
MKYGQILIMTRKMRMGILAKMIIKPIRRKRKRAVRNLCLKLQAFKRKSKSRRWLNYHVHRLNRLELIVILISRSLRRELNCSRNFRIK